MRLGDWVRAMQAAGLQATLDDLRDIAWLAGQLGGAPAAAPPATGPAVVPAPTPAPEARTGGPTPAPTAPGRGIPAPMGAAEEAAPALYAAAAGSGTLRARRVQLRGAPALPQGLAIARALRPLSRRRAGRQLVLDERATAEFIADTGVRAPVWRPARERWFDVVLLVEDVPALAAWQPVLAAFEKLLQRQGGFRSVVRWQLRAQGMQLQASGPGGRPCSPRALRERDGRRILLALSDCTSDAWHRGTMGAWLQRAAAEVPVAVVQLLPPVLWPNTAVGFAELRTRAPRVAAPAARLEVRRPGWAVGDPGLVLPVLALEPAAVAAWARMVAAAGDAWAHAALLPLPDADGTSPPPPAPEPDADARVAAFRATATLDAQRLAAYYSVVQPLTPPVMRVIHQAMAPESGAAALAQVFLAGVLRRVHEGDGPDGAVYDFHPGLRQRLEGGLTKAEFLQVNLALHDFLQQVSGTAFDFFALLEDREGSERLPEAAQPFVQMARSGARRFAGGAAPAAPASPAGRPVRYGAVAEIRISLAGARLRFQHHASERGAAQVFQPLPGDAERLLQRALTEPGESVDALRRAVMPLGLQDGTAYADGPPWAELLLDEDTERYPWELLFRSLREGRLPLALQRGLTRRPRSAAAARPARGAGALVVIPDDAAYGAAGPRQRETRNVAGALQGCLPGRVQTLLRVGPQDLLAGLAEPAALRVVHLAATGEYQREYDSEDGPRVRALLAERQPLTLDDLALRLGVPELVFLSVDHAAAVAPRLLEAGAAVVVAPTGTVHRDACAVFAETFYRVLANGQTLLEATHQARAACYQQLPDADAWGRFQVWGDPAWRLVDDVPQQAPAPAPEPRPLPALADCEHTAFISYAPADDSVWFGWAHHFARELERGLAARMRGSRLPPLFMAGETWASPLAEPLRQALESSFALVVLVHDHYLQSEWCLREVELFHALYGEAALRERLYVVAMSAPAMQELAARPAWRRLLGDHMWLPFHDDLQPARPVDIHVAAQMVSQAFRQPFERLRQDLVAKLQAGTSPLAEAAGRVRIYVESNRNERTLWEPLGEQLRRRWADLLATLVPGGAPPPELRVRGLPIDEIDKLALDDAGGIVLLWGRKTSDALVAQINKVENKLPPGRDAPPGIVAYLVPPNTGSHPMPAWGWQVLRFESKGERIEPVAEDDDKVDRFLRQVLERHCRQLGLPEPVWAQALQVAIAFSPDRSEDRQALLSAINAAAAGYVQRGRAVVLRELEVFGGKNEVPSELLDEAVDKADLFVAVLGRSVPPALGAVLARVRDARRAAGVPVLGVWRPRELAASQAEGGGAARRPRGAQDTYADAAQLCAGVLGFIERQLGMPGTYANDAPR